MLKILLKIRLKAVEQVKRILESPEMNADKLTNCTFTLVSILQSTVRDKNLQIVSTSLSCLQVRILNSNRLKKKE